MRGAGLKYSFKTAVVVGYDKSVAIRRRERDDGLDEMIRIERLLINAVTLCDMHAIYTLMPKMVKRRPALAFRLPRIHWLGPAPQLCLTHVAARKWCKALLEASVCFSIVQTPCNKASWPEVKIRGRAPVRLRPLCRRRRTIYPLRPYLRASLESQSQSHSALKVDR